MNHQHHCACRHEHLRLCSSCKVPYCQDCGKEWAEPCQRAHSGYQWFYPYVGTGTTDYTPQVTYTTCQSDGPVTGNTVSVFAHEHH
jgi:hypothetical protein